MEPASPLQTTPIINDPKTSVTSVPVGIRILQLLYLVSAVSFFLSGVYSFSLSPDEIAGASQFAIMAIAIFQLMLVFVIVLLLWGMNQGKRWSYYVALVLLVFGMLNSIWPSLQITPLVMDIVILGILILQRPYFFQAKSA
jgi:lysylphosphatidylglycerol synthetase-like protein (DUF2156 family)